jgi:RsmE family RNA methyltransferase
MNIILLTEDDFIAEGRAVLSDRRLQHIRSVLTTAPGRTLKLGMLNGKLGRGKIIQNDPTRIVLDVSFTGQPPRPSGITLLLALPRPKALRRILQSVTECGIKKIILLNSFRVEKSYWQSPLLASGQLRELLLLGLEQAGDTILPEVLLKPRFKPFVEDELPELTADAHGLIAHPAAAAPCPVNLAVPACLAIGPEGGFIPYEIEKMAAAGFRPVHLGQRILRVETAVSALLGRLSQA